MGVLRKAVIIGTAGTARVAIKSNSKKARTAKASEKTAKYQKKMYKAARGGGEVDAAAMGVTIIIVALLIVIGACIVYPIFGCIVGGFSVLMASLWLHDRKSKSRKTANLSALKPGTGSPAPYELANAGRSGPKSLVGIADELTKLTSLRDSGVLSADEFAAQKAKLLG